MWSGAANPAAPRQAVSRPADRVEPGGARPGAGRGAGSPGRCRGAGPEHARPRRDAASGPATAREGRPPRPPEARAAGWLLRRQRDGRPAPADLPPLTMVGAASEDAAALQPIIDGLREMGYSMTTVSDLIAP